GVGSAGDDARVLCGFWSKPGRSPLALGGAGGAGALGYERRRDAGGRAGGATAGRGSALPCALVPAAGAGGAGGRAPDRRPLGRGRLGRGTRVDAHADLV